MEVHLSVSHSVLENTLSSYNVPGAVSDPQDRDERRSSHALTQSPLWIRVGRGAAMLRYTYKQYMSMDSPKIPQDWGVSQERQER